MMSSDEEDDWMDEEVDENEEDSLQVMCIFCEQQSNSIQGMWKHCVDTHNFSIAEFAKNWQMDCVQYIKFINFMRQKKCTPEDLKTTERGVPLWGSDDFMRPVDSEDMLLQYDIEEELGIEESGPCLEVCERGDRMMFGNITTSQTESNKVSTTTLQPCQPNTSSGDTSTVHWQSGTESDSPYPCAGDGSNLSHNGASTTRSVNTQGDSSSGGMHQLNDDNVVISTGDYEQLQLQLKNTEKQKMQLEDQLSRALQDLEKMRLAVTDILVPESEQDHTQNNSPSVVLEDDAYFGSYSHHGIHEEMIKDKVRTEGYRDFMYRNKDLFKDKVVLDVGCGTGILSMFAANAGARLVIGVDQSDIIHHTQGIIRENNLSEKIHLIKGRIEDVDLPVEKVDIIISEWMGYFLLFESMLDSVLFARDKYLTDTGSVYPDRCAIHLALLSDEKLYCDKVTFWKDVYGFSMNSITSEVTKEAGVLVVDNSNTVSQHMKVKDIDVCSCSVGDLQFEQNFTFTVTRDTTIHAVVGYFDVSFDVKCQEKVVISTGPQCTPTHWKQTVFFLRQPFMAKTGEEISSRVSVRKIAKDPRSLRIRLTVKDHTETYFME